MDYEREDRTATRWGNAAVTLQGKKATIEDICRESFEGMPRSEDDLAFIRIKCRAWGIQCNLDGEIGWENAKRWYEAK